MNTRIIYLTFLTVALTLVSCGADQESTTEEKQEPLCFYSFNDESFDFEWTAFKTSSKIGVPGSFNEITITADESEDPIEVIESMSFTMKTATVETNNEERDGKIAEHFFNTINTPEITGNVVEVFDDGTAKIKVTMNTISFVVKGDYTFENNRFTFTSSIDVSNWNAMAGIEALNTVCKDLHTGDDGVSKLWSEVALKFSTKLVSDCD